MGKESRISNRKVAGIGIFEKGLYQAFVDGKVSPLYNRWHGMLQRCDPNGHIQRKKPAYVGCEVHPDFIKFQDFALWCHDQIGFGMAGFELDKDLLVPGNRVYGPGTCVFIPQELNSMLIRNTYRKGPYPQGVWITPKGKFRSELSVNNKNIKLGTFNTPEEAKAVYDVAKLAEIHRRTNLWKDSIDPRAYSALMNYVV